MFITRIVLKNWRNFANLDIEMRERLFVVGPNASGKSNFLDAFRFLRDVVKPAGGLQSAIAERGGLSKIRCLAARKEPDVEISVQLKSDINSETADWEYSIGIRQEVRGNRQPYLTHEKVWKNNKQILDRPDDDDKDDRLRLSQTHLEQINANAQFRDVQKFF